MGTWARRWAVPVAALLAVIFSAGFLAGRASAPYQIAAATERPAQQTAKAEDEQAQTEQPTAAAEIETAQAADAAQTQDAPTEKVNLNTADADTLQTLPGIGAVLAERIIAYREVSGGFATIEQLMEVSGIGEQKFESLREFITVEEYNEDTGR